MWAHSTKPLSFPNTTADEITCGWPHDLISATQVHTCTDSHTFTPTHTHSCTHTRALPIPNLHDSWKHHHWGPSSSWREPRPRTMWQLAGGCPARELWPTAGGPCPREAKWGGRWLAPPTSEKVSSCRTRRVLDCGKLNSHQKCWVKSSNCF